jgi:hypothetical protein
MTNSETDRLPLKDVRYQNVISNMLEINISPVNYQVLMRDVPLVNIIVYSNFFTTLYSRSGLKVAINSDDYDKIITSTSAKIDSRNHILVTSQTYGDVKTPITEHWNILRAKYEVIKTLLKKSITQGESQKRIGALTRFTDF